MRFEKNGGKDDCFAPAGLTAAQSIDGKVTTGKTAFFSQVMTKKEREELLGEYPKFFSVANMKGMAAAGAAHLVAEVGAEVVSHLAETDMGQEIVGMKEKVDEAVSNHNGIADRLGRDEAKLSDAPSLDAVGWLSSKIAALDARSVPDFDPSPGGCLKVMTSEGELLYRVLGASFDHSQGDSVTRLKEVRIYPPTGGLDVLPLATLIPDPEGDDLTKVILKQGVPFATIKCVRQSFCDSFELDFGGGNVFACRSLIPGNFECYVTKGTYEEKGSDLVGFFGGKAVAFMGPIKKMVEATECGEGMDPLSFLCYSYAVNSMRKVLVDHNPLD